MLLLLSLQGATPSVVVAAVFVQRPATQTVSLLQGATPLKKPALLALRGPAVLVKQPERTLLRLVALPGQVLERLAARQHLAAAHNPTVLVLHQVRLGQTAGGVLRRSVKNLGLGSNSEFGDHLYTMERGFYLGPQQKLDHG